MNNPLKYVDPDCNWAGWDDLIAMALGGTINLGIHLVEGDVKDGWHAITLFAIGAAVIVGAGNSIANQSFQNDGQLYNKIYSISPKKWQKYGIK